MNDGTPIIIVKKKAHGGHAHHGGSWKVAYADFVTAMMAFFMVMWIMGLSEETKASIQGYFNDPFAKVRAAPRGETLFSTKSFPNSKPGKIQSEIAKSTATEKRDVKELERKIKSELKTELGKTGRIDLSDLAKYIDVKVTDEGLRIEFVEKTGSVFFESGNAIIRPSAAKLIARLAPIFARSGRKMIVEGHTDAQAYVGTAYTNWNLSTDRALALQTAMIHDGVSPDSFDGVRGYAATRLRDPQHPLDYSNRRVSLLLPFRTAQETKMAENMPKEAIGRRVQGYFSKPVEIAP